MLARFTRWWRGATASVTTTVETAPPRPTFSGDLRAAQSSASEWCQRRTAHVALYSTLGPRALEILRRRHPERVQASVAAAERVLGHEFDLLGSGPFVPRDPDRAIRSDGYAPIDWYLDPVRNLRFPRGVPHKEWNLAQMRPGNADIKYPWELSRCQHWPVLGEAFLLTGDERFAAEIARELDDFVEANPTGRGVNWTCTMDVGIRAANWAIAFEMAHGAGALTEPFWLRAYEALFDHAVFINNNLENTYEVTSNHFLSNLLGLLFAGAVFADLPHGREWTAFARSSIAHEMDVQVLDDGADYESSVPYHRLVTELFLGAARLAAVGGHPMPSKFQARLRDMVAYLAVLTRPDGVMPQIGDADDGRLHVLGGYGATTPQDGRHLFGPGALMFDEPAWLALGGDAARWEAAWWGFEVADEERSANATREGARLFPNAGIAVARTADAYLIVTNGVVGTNGFGNHKHNDQLSFEYHHCGSPLVVDPGSYVYTSDPDMRNHFRSAASHNTLRIDSIEQNELRPDWLFRLFETARAETMAFDVGDDVVEYIGRHHGYERLASPVTHERTLRLDRRSGALLIVDRLSGRGQHDVAWHFHLAPGVDASLDGATIALEAKGRTFRLTAPAELSIVVSPALYSPSYGVAVPCLAVDMAASIDIEAGAEFTFTFTP